MAKLLQNRISESNTTLPASAVYGALLWLAGGLVTGNMYLQFAIFTVNVALLVELNNRNSMLRIRSRMVSVSYIFLTCMANFLFPNITASVTALGTTLMLTLLFLQYHDKTASGRTFYAFAVISIASMFWIQILFFVPVIWFVMLFCLQNMSSLTFAASFAGIIAPYWLAATFFFIADDIVTPTEHIMRITEFGPTLITAGMQPYQAITLAVVMILGATGGIHYMRNNFKEKIQNRMLYLCLTWLDAAAAVFLVLQPQHYDYLITMMIVFTSPLTAHFLALTSTRQTNIAACVITVVVITITILNLWMPSLICSPATDI